MLTDWVLIGRLARELDERLRGARVDSAGMLADGRVGLLLRSHRCLWLLGIDLFGSPPLVTLSDDGTGASLDAESGFPRALAGSLRGMRLTRVAARRHDRLLRITFGARSRFGVETAVELYCELVPRFGNVVLVKGDRIVATYREFSPATNAVRAVITGDLYALPPLPAKSRTLGEEAGASTDDDRLFVYRENGRLLQAYVSPLAGFESATLTREAPLLDLLAEVRRAGIERSQRNLAQRRRAASAKRLDRREERLRAEIAAIDRAREAAANRSELRIEGERIFAHLYELDASEQELEKKRATDLFARYKKLSKSLPHLENRERLIRGALDGTEMLRWELERVADEELPDVEGAIAATERHRRGDVAPKVSRGRRRARLELRTAHGSRILVGRSPVENAELTFHTARPTDLWFHVRGAPGAHVILARDGRDEPSQEDIAAAASLAAYYSNARNSGAVSVDYTVRKHVRRQRDAAPGLVWYEHARTIVAKPERLV